MMRGITKRVENCLKICQKNRTMPSQVKSYKQIEPWSIIGRLDCQRKTVGGKKRKIQAKSSNTLLTENHPSTSNTIFKSSSNLPKKLKLTNVSAGSAPTYEFSTKNEEAFNELESKKNTKISKIGYTNQFQCFEWREVKLLYREMKLRPFVEIYDDHMLKDENNCYKKKTVFFTGNEYRR